MPDRLKRTFDVAVAGAALLATAPVLAIASVAIALDSPGPVLFRHTRVGKDRRPLRTLKLRTMVASGAAGPQITASRDPRITRVGRWLRKSKLDELPQLWNVLRGEMSIVGPRPEVPQYVELYRPEWSRLLDVRPGLTDLASVVFRNEESLLALANDPARAYREVVMPMKLELALRGVDESSLRNDLRIIALTVAAILRRETSHADILAEARRRIEALNRATEGV